MPKNVYSLCNFHIMIMNQNGNVFVISFWYIRAKNKGYG